MSLFYPVYCGLIGAEDPPGNCAILVQTRQRHACVYDVIRATVDYLISKCLDGPDAPGIGGRATAEDFFGSNSTMNETSAVSAHLKRQGK